MSKKQILVDVELSEIKSVEHVVFELNRLSNPQVLLWYIGCNGLKQAAADFYKKALISPVLRNNSGAIFWLVDLTAWKAFIQPQGSLYRKSSCAEKIENFLDERIKCIAAADIFEKISSLPSKISDYFRNALRRDFIQRASANFRPTKIRVKDIFLDYSHLFSDYNDHDVANACSIFQYLEGCLLVDEIVIEQIQNGLDRECQIVFALPNDELKYYKDTESSFQKDVEHLISQRCISLGIDFFHLKIKFLAFKYGSKVHHRPYNAPGRVLKSKKLSLGSIIDDLECNIKWQCLC